MSFDKQQSLSVDNYDDFYSVPANETKKRHGIIFPQYVRSLICGPSNCGKTNVLLSILFDKNGLAFENIYVYSKSLYQPKYNFLRDVINLIEGVEYFEFNEQADIIRPENAKTNSIFIFDDIPVSDKNEIIKEYFSHGRHRSIDTIYICQTYAHIPKHLVRDNANLIILFKQDDLNLKLIHRDHVNTDMTFEKFRQLCGKCWTKPYGFLTINKDNNINNGRYRHGFDKIKV